MENNYWIEDKLLIFKPEFNEELINYYDIINKYKKVMFSNYSVKNNKYNNKFKNNYVLGLFNKEIDLSNNINLTHLTFGCGFTQEIFHLILKFY